MVNLEPFEHLSATEAEALAYTLGDRGLARLYGRIADLQRAWGSRWPRSKRSPTTWATDTGQALPGKPWPK